MTAKFIKIAAVLSFLLCGLFLSVDRRCVLLAAQSKLINDLLEEGSRVEPEQQAEKTGISRPVIEYQAEGSRDPFRDFLPRVEQVEVKPDNTAGLEFSTKLNSLRVEGTLWGGSMPQAIVNGRVVKVGDELEGARISNIDKNGVILILDGKEYKLAPPSASGASSEETKKE